MAKTDSFSIAKSRITSVFRYLQGFDQLRNPPKKRIGNQPWLLWMKNLPDHPMVQIASQGERIDESLIDPVLSGQERSNIGDSILLIVSRPTLTLPPEPPAEIASWLRHGWDRVDGSLNVHESLPETSQDGRVIEVRFEDDPSRPLTLEEWRKTWMQWVQDERPAFNTWKLFERLYELHGQLQREAEKIELVLGDGILTWQVEEEEIRHPLLVQRLQLYLNPSVPRITLSESDYSVELYSALLRTIPDVDGEVLGQFRDELEQEGYPILGDIDIEDYLKRLVVRLSARGELVEVKRKYQATANPIIYRDPVIFVRTRTLGFSRAIESILEDIPDRDQFPESLLKIVGIGSSSTPPAPSSDSVSPDGIDEKVLFSKPANREQNQIAQTLASHGCVLVQGPPGTGKTHTIANLLGDLLAQGKSVLVTSHTSKALRILIEQVDPELQPLCVSFLGSDVESRRQLERSVAAISERLTSASYKQLESEAGLFRRERHTLLNQLTTLRKSLLDTLIGEYKIIEVGRTPYSPSDAARIVASGIGRHDWIPSPITLGISLPLSPEELRELYLSNTTISPDDERELLGPLPNKGDLLSPDQFEHLVDKWLELKDAQQDFDSTLWENSTDDQDLNELIRIQESALQAIQIISDAPRWQLEAISAGRKGGDSRSLWEDFIKFIIHVNELAASSEQDIMQYEPKLAEDIPYRDQRIVLEDIINHLQQGNKWGRLTILRHSSWRKTWSGLRVAGSSPYLPEHFQALQKLVTLLIARVELLKRWEHLMVKHGADSIPSTEKHPERICEQAVNTLRESVNWYTDVWRMQENEFQRIGFRLSKLVGQRVPEFKQHGELIRLHKVVTETLQRAFGSRVNRLQYEMTETQLSQLAERLSHHITGQSSSIVVQQLRDSVINKNKTGYRKAFERVLHLAALNSIAVRRNTLLERLDRSAPGWAEAIRNRYPPHHADRIPGDAAAAWLWRQLHDELEHRFGADINQLQHEISKSIDELQRITTALVDRLAWAAQVHRTTLEQRQALVGWLHTIRRIGAGHGRRVPQLRVQARKLMSDCRSSVPVWIMPIARVLENFSPTASPFDVVIIDEASQSDVMALVNLYIARQTIISR